MSEEKRLATADDLRNVARGVRRFKSDITLPISGLTVRIRSLTKKELSDYQLTVVNAKTGKPREERIRDAEDRLFVLCLVGDDGNPILTAADTGIFAEWDAADTQALYTECSVFVGLNRDDLESLVKN